MFYRDLVLGCDPTDVERVMLQVRRVGAFKPWGTAVSMIEVACLDITGKAYGLPIYKLLGGKVRDSVRVYNGNVRFDVDGDYGTVAGRIEAASVPPPPPPVLFGPPGSFCTSVLVLEQGGEHGEAEER